MPLYTGEIKQPPRDYTPHPNDVISRSLANDAREDRIMAGAGAAWGATRVADQWVRTSPTYDPSRGISQIFDKPVADLKDTVTAFRKGTPTTGFNPDPYRGMAPGNHPQLSAPSNSKALMPATQRIATDFSRRVADPRFTTKNRLKATWKGVSGNTLNKLLALAVPYKLYQAHKTDELRKRYLAKDMTLQEVNKMRYDRGIVGATKTAGTVDTFRGAHNMPRVAGVPSASGSTPAAPKMKTAAEDHIATTPSGLAAIGLGGLAGAHFGAAAANYEALNNRKLAVYGANGPHKALLRNKQYEANLNAYYNDWLQTADPKDIESIRKKQRRDSVYLSAERSRLTKEKEIADKQRNMLRRRGQAAKSLGPKYLKRGAGLLAGTAAMGAYAVHDWNKNHPEKTASDNMPSEVTPLSMASTAGAMNVVHKAMQNTPMENSIVADIVRKQRGKLLRNGALFTAGAVGLGAYNRWKENQVKTAAHEDDVAVLTLNKRDAAAKGALGLGMVGTGALYAAADATHDLMTTKNRRRGSIMQAKHVARDYKANKQEWDAIQNKINDKRNKLFDLKMETDMFTPEGKAEYDRLRGLGEKLDNIESDAHKAYLKKDSDLFHLKTKLKYERKLDRVLIREAMKTRKNALIGAGVSGAAALGLGAYALHNDTQD